MRTNIVINDTLIEEAMLLTGIKTKREVVEEALRLLVRINKQKSVLGLRGQIQWDGDLDQMRQGRFLSEERAQYGAEPTDQNSTNPQ